MIAAHLADVGDGMAAGIETISQKMIQIDCGSQQSSSDKLSYALRIINPDVFILSHFHSDHYNGLLRFGSRHHPRGRLSVENVLLPRIPVFPQRDQFLNCMFAVNKRVLGGVSGSMEMDFLNVLSRINRQPFSYRLLSAGESFSVEDSSFQVLWPPREVRRNATLQVIKTAISDFGVALRKDQPLREIYYEIEERNIIHPYLNDNGGRVEFEQSNISREQSRNLFLPRELPKATVRANDSLRKAANHISLAIQEDNRLLFLGDLEKYQLGQVTKKLLRKGRTRFQVLITPHHGTHWSSSLNKLKCFCAFSSVGPKLIKNICPAYKEITDKWYVTYFLGNISLPVAFSVWQKPWFFRYRFPFI